MNCFLRGKKFFTPFRTKEAKDSCGFVSMMEKRPNFLETKYTEETTCKKGSYWATLKRNLMQLEFKIW